jgi:K+-transporting ATPase KdpF subunit
MFWPDRALRQAGGEAMSAAWYWAGGIVAAALLVYLVVALFDPEFFE